MLRALIMLLFVSSGKGLISLGYGKEGMAAREKLGKKIPDGLAFFFGLLVFIWLFFGVFFFFVSSPGSEDALISLILIIACPAVYAIWFLVTRKSVPKLVEESGKIQDAL